MGVAEDFAPFFIKKPQLRQEDDGNRLIFECQLQSSPAPNIEWYRSDTLVVENERTKLRIIPIEGNKYTVLLEIDDVLDTDAGLYKVRAKNSSGEVSASINLNFSPADEPKEKQIDGFAPTFAKKPSIRQEDEGKRLLFECTVNADPQPVITWFHNDKTVYESPRHKLSVKKDGHSYFATLELKNVTVEDAGKYKVNGKNDLGESNATISLNFDSTNDANGFAPSFIEKPKIVPNDSGTLITMKCRCKAKPEPTVTWYRGKEVVNKSKKIGIKTAPIGEDSYELTLEIKDPGAADGGTYRCNVKNEFGESNANLNLNIEAEAEPDGEGPTFVEKPRIVSENSGKLIIMECKVKADPKPKIVWYRNNEIVNENNKIKMSVEQRGDHYYIKLEMIDPQIEDSGLYKCNIKNNLGELNANLTLNIEIIPVIKDKPKIIKIIKKRTVVIECTVASKYEPKCTWFKESNIVKESSRHVCKVQRSKEGEFAVQLEINDVDETDKGAYKLVASNEKGEAVSQIVHLIDIPEAERKPKKPEIDRKLTDQRIVESKSFDLTIKLKETDRSCKIEWYKGSALIRETKEITTTFDGTTARLTFSAARVEHTASYKVIVSNEVGKAESTCKVVVEKKQEKSQNEEQADVKRKEEEEVIQKKENIDVEKSKGADAENKDKKESKKTNENEKNEIEKKIENIPDKVVEKTKESANVPENTLKSNSIKEKENTKNEPESNLSSNGTHDDENIPEKKELFEKIGFKKTEQKTLQRKIVDENKPVDEFPKLKKTPQVKDEPKQEQTKTKTKTKPKAKSKYEDLPEIPDYERPQLEKFEKPEFDPSDFSRDTNIPSKMEKPILDSLKKSKDLMEAPNISKEQKAEINTDDSKKGFQVGKGKLEEDSAQKESATLKPVIVIPEKLNQMNDINKTSEVNIFNLLIIGTKCIILIWVYTFTD
uniref:Ig-like domain-containing protein n=1 Tax=Musca domestica TaxID=7370 RepID=A0A1I8MIJ3_MUSDO